MAGIGASRAQIDQLLAARDDDFANTAIRDRYFFSVAIDEKQPKQRTLLEIEDLVQD